MASNKLTVIYEARTVPEAQTLKERLLEADIPAVLGDEIVEGDAVSDVWGLPEPVRVAVDQDQAEAARRIAMDFDAEIVVREQAAARRPDARLAEEDEAPERSESPLPREVAAGPAVWPRCPECGSLRLTRCPACQATGADFPRGEVPEEAAAEPMVICPECDEPFTPQYARRCHRCGHEFADGFSLTSEGAADRRTRRVLFAICVLVTIVVGLLIYFATLV